MIHVARFLLPLFLLLNVTMTQNNWSIGVYFYYFSIVVCFFLLMTTKLSRYAIFIIPLMIVAKITELSLPELGIINTVLSGLLFFLVGFIAYSNRPEILRKALIFYLLVSIPIMLMQTSGVSPVLMYWNTDYSHTLGILDLNEIGTFKNITQYPTLFVDIDELYYQIGQGRPSGLMPANNLLSVIIVFALVLNLHLRKRNNLNIGDLVVNMSVVISMSKLTLFVALFLYLSEIFSRYSMHKTSAAKNLLTLLFLFFLYYFFFPGMLEINYRLDSVVFSFGIRLIDLATTFGADGLLAALSSSLDFYDPNNIKMSGHSSGIALAFDSYLLIPSLICLVMIYKKFKKKLERLKLNSREKYRFIVIFVISVLMIFSVIPVFFFSPLFLFILGAGFYPLANSNLHLDSFQVKN